MASVSTAVKDEHNKEDAGDAQLTPVTGQQQTPQRVSRISMKGAISNTTPTSTITSDVDDDVNDDPAAAAAGGDDSSFNGQASISNMILTSMRSFAHENLQQNDDGDDDDENDTSLQLFPSSPMKKDRRSVMRKQRMETSTSTITTNINNNKSVRWEDSEVEGSSRGKLSTSFTTTTSSSSLSSSFRKGSGLMSSTDYSSSSSSSSSSKRNVQANESATLLPPTTGADLDAVYFHSKVELSVRNIQSTFRRRAAERQAAAAAQEAAKSVRSSSALFAQGGSSSAFLFESSQTMGTEQDKPEEEEKEHVDRSALYMFLFVGIFGMGLILFKVIARCFQRFKKDDDELAENTQTVGEQLAEEAGVEVIGNSTGGGGGAAGGAAGAGMPPPAPGPPP
jgi:hypothetical protein